MRKSVFTSFVVASILAGCGSFVPVVKLDEVSKEKLVAAQRMKLWGASQLVGQKYDVLTIAEGNSCQNKLTDPPATRAAAIEQVKYHAMEIGADGVANVQCGPREGTSLRTNCWELISCTGEAIKLAQ